MGIWTSAVPGHVPEFLMQLPDWASQYVGIPYVDYGRTHDGCDCWGLARLIWKEQAGIDLPEFDVDPRDGEAAEDAILSNMGPWELVVPGDEHELDGVLMTGCFGKGLDTRRAAMHVGIVIADGLLIHTTANTGASVIARYRDRMLGHSVVGFYRHRSIDA